MSFESLLNVQATIQRKGTPTRDRMGGYSDVDWTDLATIDCRIQPMSADERLAYGKETVFATHKMFCTTNIAFTENDRIVYNGTYYDIIEIRNIDLLEHHFEVSLVETK